MPTMPVLKLFAPPVVDQNLGTIVTLTGDALNDIASGAAVTAADARALDYVYNPGTGVMERQRTISIRKSVQASASGDTAVWTPAAGKSFRLMGGVLTLPVNVNRAAGGVITATFRDVTTDLLISFDFFVPTTAVTTGNGATNIPFNLPGNGVLSAAANNVLNINLSAQITTGALRVSVYGTEE